MAKGGEPRRRRSRPCGDEEVDARAPRCHRRHARPGARFACLTPRNRLRMCEEEGGSEGGQLGAPGTTSLGRSGRQRHRCRALPVLMIEVNVDR